MCKRTQLYVYDPNMISRFFFAHSDQFHPQRAIKFDLISFYKINYKWSEWSHSINKMRKKNRSHKMKCSCIKISWHALSDLTLWTCFRLKCPYEVWKFWWWNIFDTGCVENHTAEKSTAFGEYRSSYGKFKQTKYNYSITNFANSLHIVW